jgi:hypothetical protein
VGVAPAARQQTVPVEWVVAVRRSNSLPTMTKLARPLSCGAAALLIVVPLAAASPGTPAPTARSAATAGAVYGGITAQDFPVIIELRSNRRQVVRAAIGIRLSCTSGGRLTLPDNYTRVPVSKKGKFTTSFGPITQRNDDGTTSDIEGTMSGRLNAARTKVSGKWQLKTTDHDTTGAVTDTCDSGSVSWKAKQ